VHCLSWHNGTKCICVKAGVQGTAQSTDPAGASWALYQDRLLFHVQ